MNCDASWAIAWARCAADSIAEHRTELTELDAAIGDADHGDNLHRGFKAVRARLDELERSGQLPNTPAAVMQEVARTLLGTVGGASGPLLGNALMRGARECPADHLEAADVARMLTAAAEAITVRGHAEVGDKTLLDVWATAAQAAREAAEAGGTLDAVLHAACDAADRGAQETVALRARKGRASYLGERSRGHMDPGARSSQLIVHAALAALTDGSQGGDL